MTEWPVLESGVEHDGYFVTTGYDEVEHPDGSRQQYEWIDLADIVVIVGVTDTDVIFIEQYRPTIGQRVLECPAGAIEHGESPEDAAVRELREETGYRAGSVTHLYTHNPLPGLLRHDLSGVFADDLSPGATDRDEGEFLT